MKDEAEIGPLSCEEEYIIVSLQSLSGWNGKIGTARAGSRSL